MADGDYTPTRVCTACKNQYPATSEYFHAYKRSPDGRRSVCRRCRAIDHTNNAAVTKLQRKEHYSANKDRLSAASRDYYAANADAQRKLALLRHHTNRDKRVEQMRDYRAANIDALNERRRPRDRAAFQARYGVDLEFTMKHRMRSLLRVTLKRGRDGKRMVEILGYTTDELRIHLERQFERGMTWARFMAGEIHIDHIIPVAEFEIADENSDGFRQCWALSNLRPSWAADNLSKQAKVLTLL